VTNRQTHTDHATPSVAVGRIVCSACDMAYKNADTRKAAREAYRSLNWPPISNNMLMNNYRNGEEREGMEGTKNNLV